jgi:hypothetical protein
MLVEGLGSVTFVNGILRIQCTSVDPEGKAQESGTIEIPGSAVGTVIQGMSAAAQGISDKLNENAETPKENKKDNGKDKKAKK